MTAPASSPSFDEVSRQLAELRRRVEELEVDARSASLGHSSIQDGKLNVYDGDNTIRQTIGRQADGNFAVSYANGPKPPVPSTPIAVAGQLSIILYWDGKFFGGVDRPSDFQRIDVHVSTDAAFVPSSNTVYLSLLEEGVATVPFDRQQYFVKYVAVTTSDNASDASTAVPVFPNAAKQIDAQSIGAEQLKSNIILASDIYAGDPTSGDYVRINSSGLYVFDQANQIRAMFQGQDVMVSGEIRTASEGERLVLNEADAGDPTFRAYPGTGTNFAEIKSRTWTTSGVDYAGFEIQAPATINQKSRVLNQIIDPTIVGDNTLPRQVTYFLDANGNPNWNGAIDYVQYGSEGSMLMRNNVKNIGILWGNGLFYLTGADGNGRVTLHLGSFVTANSSTVNGQLTVQGGNIVRPGSWGLGQATGGNWPVLYNVEQNCGVVASQGKVYISDSPNSINIPIVASNISERKHKHHVANINHESGDFIDHLWPARYTWRDPDTWGRDHDEHVGLYVDEIAEADPSLVITMLSSDDRSYEDRGILAYLVAEVQNLRRRLAAVEIGSVSQNSP